MQIFAHCLYEIEKGVRDLALLTLEVKHLDKIIKRLEKEQIHFHIQNIKNEKINLYFGKPSCVDIVKSFDNQELNKLSAEQDFILGIMLGYHRENQCKRYLAKKRLA